MISFVRGLGAALLCALLGGCVASGSPIYYDGGAYYDGYSVEGPPEYVTPPVVVEGGVGWRRGWGGGGHYRGGSRGHMNRGVWGGHREHRR